MKPRRGRRETTGKVLKERRSPRRRGRMGTSVDTTARARGGGAGGGTGDRRTAGDGVVRAERATRLRIHSMRRSQGPMARVGDAGSGGGVVVFETRSEKLRSAPEIVQSARGQQRASQRARFERAREARTPRGAPRTEHARPSRHTQRTREENARRRFHGSEAVHVVRARALSASSSSSSSSKRSVDRTRDRSSDSRRDPSLPPPPSPRSTTTVPYLTAADANAVCTTLSVDNELQPDKVEKTLRVDGASLVACVRFPRFSPRFLRANIRVARGRTGGSARPSPLRSRESDLTTTSSRPRHSRSSPETSRRPSRGSCAPRSPRSWTSSTSRRARSKSSAPCPPNFRQSRERPRERPAARTSRRAETLDTTRP